MIAIIGMLIIWKNLSSPQKNEARREKARVGLISKTHYQPQMTQFDVLDDPRLRAKIEEKQGGFRLDRFRPFAFQHGSTVHNPSDHNSFLMPQIINKHHSHF